MSIGKDIHLFFAQTGGHCSDLCVKPRPYGWQIPNFGYGGLKERLRAEEKRLKEMKEAMDQIHEIVRREMDRYYIGRVGPPRSTAERVANVIGELKPRSPGYLRLPLYNSGWAGPPGSRASGYMDEYSLHPVMPKMEVWEMPGEKGCDWCVRCTGWEELAGYFTPPCKEDDTCECSFCVR